MGTDIHIEVFVKDGNGRYYRVAKPARWEWDDPLYQFPYGIVRDEDEDFVYSWPEYRNYYAFGLLCDGMRGNSGPFPARGIPEFVEALPEWRRESLDLGDHSYSWLTLPELETITWDRDEWSDGTKGYEPFFKTLLIPMLQRIRKAKGVEEVIMVFGFDS